MMRRFIALGLDRGWLTEEPAEDVYGPWYAFDGFARGRLRMRPDLPHLPVAQAAVDASAADEVPSDPCEPKADPVVG